MAAAALESRLPFILLHGTTSSISGFALGYLAGVAIRENILGASRLVPHSWAFGIGEAAARKAKRFPTWATILTELDLPESSPETTTRAVKQHVLYRGLVENFGLGLDGRFNYVLLRDTKRFLLRNVNGKPFTTSRSAQLVGNADDEAAGQAVSRVVYIVGSTIKNISFESIDQEFFRSGGGVPRWFASTKKKESPTANRKLQTPSPTVVWYAAILRDQLTSIWQTNRVAVFVRVGDRYQHWFGLGFAKAASEQAMILDSGEGIIGESARTKSVLAELTSSTRHTLHAINAARVSRNVRAVVTVPAFEPGGKVEAVFSLELLSKDPSGLETVPESTVEEAKQLAERHLQEARKLVPEITSKPPEPLVGSRTQ